MTRRWNALSDDGTPAPDAVEAACALLRGGGLVALPTETVYGLGAHALDPEAVQRIYAAKGRPSFNPLIVHIPDLEAARPLVADLPPVACALAAAFWPGPLTLVVPRAHCVPDVVTGGGDTVALRAPAHPVMQAVLRASGLPIAAPSANRSGSISPTTADHVLAGLAGRIDAVLDAGPCAVGIESTVVDCTTLPVRVLRPGSISAEAIARVAEGAQRVSLRLDEGTRASPGLLTRHYAPSGAAQLLPRGRIDAALAALPRSARIGLVTLAAHLADDPRVVAAEAIGADPAEAARRLYAALHAMDAAAASHVLLEEPPSTADWEAVADRLRRAAAPAES